MTDAPAKPRIWSTTRLGYLVALTLYLIFHIALRLRNGEPVSYLQGIGTAILALSAVILIGLRVRETRAGQHGAS